MKSCNESLFNAPSLVLMNILGKARKYFEERRMRLVSWIKAMWSKLKLTPLFPW